MARRTIGLLHPGDMGSVLGALLTQRGFRVLWASAGRSAATRSRAATLEEVRTLRELVQASELILSVCPPHAALDMAQQVAADRFAGAYADLNAISPETARAIGRVIEGAGMRFIDGGIVGPPPATPGTTGSTWLERRPGASPACSKAALWRLSSSTVPSGRHPP